MPGFITHYICGLAVSGEIPYEARDIITRYRCIYNMGTQGPDIFFYYLPGMLRKRTRDIGVMMHRRQVGVFLKSLAGSVQRAANEEEKHILFSYAAGYLTHYALDACAHPYVYARIGDSDDNGGKKPLKNSVNHRRLETAIDVLMLKLMSGEKPSDYKLWQLVRADAAQTRTAAAAVSHAIKLAYARDVGMRDVYKAMVYMVQLTRLLQSRKGRRKICLERVEDLTVGEPLISSIIHLQEIKDGVDYMNMEKTFWNADQNDSFVELYHQAVTDAAEMVQMLYAYMCGSVSFTQLVTRLGSRSLATGAEL